ncbi:hypothetical protein PT273_05135 [Orbaceae bacterium ESL0727]|nr:hypothetical protein [Orbaceae bacterium ESL0727]
MNNQEELNQMNHLMIDSMILIIACLFLTEQIQKNNRAVFIHNDIELPISRVLVMQALKINIKSMLINQLGEEKGLNRTYAMFSKIYQHGKTTMELTLEGRTLLTRLFEQLAEKNADKLVPTTH